MNYQRTTIRRNACGLIAIAAGLLPNAGHVRSFSQLFLPYVNAWTMSFRPDSGGTAGPALLWEDRMDTITWHGRPAMRREQFEHTAPPPSTAGIRYVNVFDAQSLEPLMTESRRADGVFDRWEFDGLRVRETRSVPGGHVGRQPPGTKFDSATTTYVVSERFVDYLGGMYASVVAAQPLSVGLDSSFAALVRPHTVARIRFRVAAQEMVKGPSHELVLAYRVDIGAREGPGGFYTAWIIKAPPYVLRLTTPQKNPPGEWSWDEAD